MLLKAVLLLASALVTTATTTSDASNSAKAQNLGVLNCAECLPCLTTCKCPPSGQTSCKMPASFTPPQDPFGRLVCAENQPCRSDCVCQRALHPVDRPLTSDGRLICPEGQPCPNDNSCFCSMSNLLSYINPNNLSPDTVICPEGNCTDACICREDLLGSVKDVLFPKNGTKIIDFAPKESVTVGRDEL